MLMLILPPEQRSKFKKPFGKLFPGINEALPEITGRKIYSVGDVVTHNLIKAGIVPDIAVVDGNTMRQACSCMQPVSSPRIDVKNPAGTITDELTEALKGAVSVNPRLISVDGEEDLAVIPLATVAPDSSVILYGQPHEGVVVLVVDASAREKAEELLSLFEYVSE